ncbi:DUF6420 family protein [Streptomyces violascens]|uniref:DUF6420 family protein n=1 Tax=Streptomyces violascens TaxID=67381 RepID=UPI003656FFE4
MTSEDRAPPARTPITTTRRCPQVAVLRSFTLRTGSPDLTAFVRAALAIELGDERRGDRLLKDTEALAGPVRRAAD